VICWRADQASRLAASAREGEAGEIRVGGSCRCESKARRRWVEKYVCMEMCALWRLDQGTGDGERTRRGGCHGVCEVRNESGGVTAVFGQRGRLSGAAAVWCFVIGNEGEAPVSAGSSAEGERSADNGSGFTVMQRWRTQVAVSSLLHQRRSVDFSVRIRRRARFGKRGICGGG